MTAVAPTPAEPWLLLAVQFVVLGVAGYVGLLVRGLRREIGEVREKNGEILAQVQRINGRLQACERDLGRLAQWREDHHNHDEQIHAVMTKDVDELKASIRGIHDRIDNHSSGDPPPRASRRRR